MRRIGWWLLWMVPACGGDGSGRGDSTFGLPSDSGTATSSSGGMASSVDSDPAPATSMETTGGASGTSTGADGDASSGGSTGGPVGPVCPGPGDPLDCSPGPGSGEADTCTDDPSCFLGLVQMSVNGVIADMPAWFDQSDGQPFVLEVESYMNEVVARVSAAGQCSIRDPNAGDEIVVKHDNAFAENFDILTAEGYARYGAGIYTSKCIPAWF